MRGISNNIRGISNNNVRGRGRGRGRGKINVPRSDTISDASSDASSSDSNSLAYSSIYDPNQSDPIQVRTANRNATFNPLNPRSSSLATSSVPVNLVTPHLSAYGINGSSNGSNNSTNSTLSSQPGSYRSNNSTNSTVSSLSSQPGSYPFLNTASTATGSSQSSQPGSSQFTQPGSSQSIASIPTYYLDVLDINYNSFSNNTFNRKTINQYLFAVLLLNNNNNKILTIFKELCLLFFNNDTAQPSSFNFKNNGNLTFYNNSIPIITLTPNMASNIQKLLVNCALLILGNLDLKLSFPKKYIKVNDIQTIDNNQSIQIIMCLRNIYELLYRDPTIKIILNNEANDIIDTTDIGVFPITFDYILRLVGITSINPGPIGSVVHLLAIYKNEGNGIETIPNSNHIFDSKEDNAYKILKAMLIEGNLPYSFTSATSASKANVATTGTGTTTGTFTNMFKFPTSSPTNPNLFGLSPGSLTTTASPSAGAAVDATTGATAPTAAPTGATAPTGAPADTATATAQKDLRLAAYATFFFNANGSINSTKCTNRTITANNIGALNCIVNTIITIYGLNITGSATGPAVNNLRSDGKIEKYDIFKNKYSKLTDSILDKFSVFETSGHNNDCLINAFLKYSTVAQGLDKNTLDIIGDKLRRVFLPNIRQNLLDSDEMINRPGIIYGKDNADEDSGLNPTHPNAHIVDNKSMLLSNGFLVRPQVQLLADLFRVKLFIFYLDEGKCNIYICCPRVNPYYDNVKNNKECEQNGQYMAFMFNPGGHFSTTKYNNQYLTLDSEPNMNIFINMDKTIIPCPIKEKDTLIVNGIKYKIKGKINILNTSISGPQCAIIYGDGEDNALDTIFIQLHPITNVNKDNPMDWEINDPTDSVCDFNINYFNIAATSTPNVYTLTDGKDEEIRDINDMKIYDDSNGNPLPEDSLLMTPLTFGGSYKFKNCRTKKHKKCNKNKCKITKRNYSKKSRKKTNNKLKKGRTSRIRKSRKIRN
jgi:hypothetical protein